MGKIVICRADQVVEKTATLKPVAVLSIEHPDVKPDEPGAAPRLADGTKQMILSFWDSEQDVAGAPDIGQVEQGIAFVMENIARGDVIIHCHAGKSRSVAVALGVLSLLHPCMGENELIEKILEIRPESAPNIAIVCMADELTGRGGKLLKAVKDHPEMSAARSKAETGRRRWLEKNPEIYKKMHPEKFPPEPKPDKKNPGI